MSGHLHLSIIGAAKAPDAGPTSAKITARMIKKRPMSFGNPLPLQDILYTRDHENSITLGKRLIKIGYFINIPDKNPMQHHAATAESPRAGSDILTGCRPHMFHAWRHGKDGIHQFWVNCHFLSPFLKSHALKRSYSSVPLKLPPPKVPMPTLANHGNH